MMENYQPPYVIAEMAEMVCSQFGIQLQENFVHRRKEGKKFE